MRTMLLLVDWLLVDWLID